MFLKLRHAMVCMAMLACSACASGGTGSVAFQPARDTDTLLTCDELRLEMHEAEYYRDSARRSQGPSLGGVVAPLSYLSNYMDATGRIGKAEERLEHLGDIYRIKGCSNLPPGVMQAQQQPRMPVGNPYGYGTPYAAMAPMMIPAPAPVAAASAPVMGNGSYQAPAMQPPALVTGVR